VVLLHGLAGYAGEWADTASWLTERCRVVAPDARGHGESERLPADVSPEAQLADALFLVEELRLGPAVVVGHSLGGLTALRVAAARPDLVRGLVVADASPAPDDAASVAEVSGWLREWPVPFPSREAAVEFFGGQSLRAEAWADGLGQRDGGWWPRFDVDVMVRTLDGTVGRSHWREWERIRCPTLVVRAGAGMIPAAEARSMTERLPHASLVELDGAEHDLHLDQPDAWRSAVTEFLDEL
jgi:pimeloyl-ACP methyl ester carboxylesterase